MGEQDIGSTTTTNLTNLVKDFEVPSIQPDSESPDLKETFYDFNEATTELGFYFTIPEFKKAIDALAIWTVGKGMVVNTRTGTLLNRFNGWGQDTIQTILFNMLVMKKVCKDSFAEIIRDEDGNLLNLKPLWTGDMRIVMNPNGTIKRYEKRGTSTGGVEKAGVNETFRLNQILHLSNDRVANQIHGTSVTEAVKGVIEARNEAMADWKRILHRSTIRILYVDVDKPAKLNVLKKQYAEAIDKGEVLVLPGKPSEQGFQDLTAPPSEIFLSTIQYYENFFYQAVGVPRVIATSENFTEASSKVGYLTFEPIYTREQVDLENDLYAQLGLQFKFNRPPSLTGNVQDTEDKNTGQTGFQDSETEVSAERSE